ncbi:CopD family protein [Limnohabitans sp.]|uniref:CopD family protein n=1 Tax=Limnohabitans sp. TaxID=1907725 RepID=UPI00391CF992
MYEWMKWLHLAAGVVWLGGMTLMVWAVRPAAIALLAPEPRLRLMQLVLSRFFRLVWAAIAVLLASGLWMLGAADLSLAPRGWHAMAALGSLMILVFAHLYFAPFRRLSRAVAAQDWPMGARALGQIHPLVMVNLGLGWTAVLAVMVWR